jgi:V-type H+-transporting ATPase subunit e
LYLLFGWQVTLVLTGVLCWLFWFCCYLSQINPLIGQ